ncbi:hypothetical protein BOW51_09400 [Solemya velesiana gill symbiont]|uniref:Uncharacterized protein n=1 Tax=Solemya velesiana gill symbiont TaxID=1918948 RepID=A0A1T2KSZ8_9GAMM|nr:hypothetical protein BOW51_09400 [Solemya velesiana gill symbiont]
MVIDATEHLINELRNNGDAIKVSPRLAFDLANEKIIPLIDFSTIARSVLGQHWRQASQQQRQQFTSEFRSFTINFFLKAMSTYSEEIVDTADSFTYPPDTWTPGNTRATVFMDFKLKDGLKT